MIRETPRQTPLLRGQVEMDIPRFEVSTTQLYFKPKSLLHSEMIGKIQREVVVFSLGLMRMRSLKIGDMSINSYLPKMVIGTEGIIHSAIYFFIHSK